MSKVVSFRVDQNTYTALHQAAAEAGMSPSQMARVFCEQGMGGDVQTQAVTEAVAAVQRRLVHAVRRLTPKIRAELMEELRMTTALDEEAPAYNFGEPEGLEPFVDDEPPVTPRPRPRGGKKRRGKRGGRR
jgi:hypothetical protein